MRKFKGKRRHRNKANNAQAQSSAAAAKMVDAQQPSASGVGLHAEVDLDDGGRVTIKAQDASSPVDLTNQIFDDGITSSLTGEELKGKATEKKEQQVKEEMSDKEEKSEDNNNEKGSNEIQTFQKGEVDTTSTDAFEEDVGDHDDDLDDPMVTKEDADDDQKDLFIIEESDQKTDIDDNKNSVTSANLDCNVKDKECISEQGTSKTELYLGEESNMTFMKPSNGNETFNPNSFENAETTELVARIEESPTEYLPEEIQGIINCGDDDVEHTQGDLNIIKEENEKKCSSEAEGSSTSVYLETQEDAGNQESTCQRDAERNCSANEPVRFASCSDDIADEAVTNESESAFEEPQARADQSDVERASYSSSERTESVDHDQFEDAHEIPDEDGEDAEVENKAEDDHGNEVSQWKVKNPKIPDDVFEVVDSESISTSCKTASATLHEETDEVVESIDEVIQEVKEVEEHSEPMSSLALPGGEIIKENNEISDRIESQSGSGEDVIAASSELPDGNGEHNMDISNTFVDVGGSVDNHSEMEGASVGSGLDSKVDNGVDIDVNLLDTSGEDDKDQIVDTMVQEEESQSPDPSRSLMCEEQQQEDSQQQQVQTSMSPGSDEGHLHPLEKVSQSGLDLKQQQQHQEELLQPQVEVQQQQQQEEDPMQQQQQQQQEEELLQRHHHQQQQEGQQYDELLHQQKQLQDELLKQKQQELEQQELLQQQKKEIEHLQQQVREQQEANTRLQAHSHAQQIQANLLTTSLRSKLRRKERDLKSVKSQHETCISAVISHLLYLEGQMQKEHKQVLGVLKEKDDVIRRQKAALEDVTDKNDQLVMALKESSGYDVMDNGLSRPPIPVVMQNGKYPIQDHGNKVVLRGHKATNGSHKVRFSSMKERLRRHKSSLELYHTEPLEPLLEGTLRYFGSQENLVDGDTGYLETRTRSAYINARKQRCRSLIEGPSDLQEADEIHNESPDSCFGEESLSSENISQSDSYSMGRSPPTSSSYYYGKRSESVPANIGMNELAKSRSVPQALPTVSEKDGVGGRSWQSRERPHSVPSAGLLVGPKSGLVAGSAKISMSPSMSIPTTAAIQLPPSTLSSSSSSSSVSSSSQSAQTTSSSSSSSLTESIKNVFKRRGSKKKRSVSLGQTTNQQYQNSIKQHFKKYDMT